MQFGKFELKPPSTTKDVVCVIEALKEKQVRDREGRGTTVFSF